MKESISVFCRVKPSKEAARHESSTVDKLKQLEIVVPKLDTDGHVNNKNELHRYKFNEIFEQSAYQDQVFSKVAKPVVDSVLNGYNGTIFAYGQTGSGKTFTVTGGAEKYADRGLIPRTLSYLFEQFMSDDENDYKMQISYLELYNENGYDLLSPAHDFKGLEDLPKVTILEDPVSGIKIRNLQTFPVSTEEEAVNQLFVGDTNRSIAETPMNMASTRGHCIFTLYIESRRSESSIIKRSKLHLVDLAGSERIGKSSVEWKSQVAREGKYINLSLHYLEQVIVALSEKKRDHVPYRNSILTSVLRDSLGGNSITSMIATVSLEPRNIQESLATCRFAQRVAKIKNEAVLNEELDPSLQIQRLKREVNQLKEQIRLQDGSPNAGELLTESEKHDLDYQIQNFLKDPDPETVMNLDGDMRKINYSIKRLKKVANSSGRPEGIVRESGESSSNANVKHGAKQFQITPEELIRLKEILEQRDTEIAVLTQLLKKERRKPRQTAQYSPEKYTNPPLDPASSSTVAVSDDVSSNILKMSSNSMSEGRKMAFERWRADVYVEDKSYREQKKELGELILQAKAKGSKIHENRAVVNRLKGELTHKQEQIAVREATGHSDNELVQKANDIRREIEINRRNYQDAVLDLKKIKPEVEHLKHSIERQRIEMHKKFDKWFQDEAERNSLRSSSAASFTAEEHASRPASRASQATGVSLTGDAQADSDIQAFIQARQRILAQRQS